MEARIARLVVEKDLEVSRVQGEAQKRAAELTQEATAAVLRFESEVRRQCLLCLFLWMGQGRCSALTLVVVVLCLC